MKKITLLMFIFLSITGWSKGLQGYKFHILQDFGSNIGTAISIGCAETITPGLNREVNLWQNSKLEVGRIYKSEIITGTGTRYYKVLYASDSYQDRGSDIDEPAPFELIPDLCNSLSWKYIRPMLLGSTLEEAQSNFCSNLTANNARYKVNVKITNPLKVGDIYLMDFGLGPNYYIIDASNVESGSDAAFDLDPTNSNSVFSFVSLNSCPQVDLLASKITINNYNDSYRGTSKEIEYTIFKKGANIQNTNTLLIFYLSKYNSLNSGQIEIARRLLNAQEFNHLDNNTGIIRYHDFTIPNNVSNGNYYVIMKITNTEDFNPRNNTVSTTSSFIVKDGAPTPTPTPTPTLEKPDLTIDSNDTFIYSECSDCNSKLSELGTKRHRINNSGGILNLQQIMIKNLGNIPSSPTNIQFYLSSNNTLDTGDLKANGNGTTLSTIATGGSITISRSIFPSDFGNGGTTFNGNWNILIAVDDSKTNTELNENNNVIVIPVTFYNPFGKLTSTKNLTYKSETELNKVTKPYSIDIYNFQGQKVLTKKVNTKEEENKLLESLEKGFYIIKSNNTTKKIHKE